MERKEKILWTALELFAREGYHSVSTRAIAYKAGVSEGLLFRFFGSKENLLHHIMEVVDEKLKEYYAPIFDETDPKKALRMAIALPFESVPKEPRFWKLHYKLLWELELSYRPHTAPFIDKLTRIFTDLGFEKPKMEAEVFHLILESLASAILRDELYADFPMDRYLYERYDLTLTDSG